ncbi:putative metabolite transport protein [Salmonella enterica subsp. enterica]|uniref:Putative metabolite transport protein n=1 Tax=Salmonella enterica I TaxID=59201 RepID=A0A3S5DM19_SALET|nr:putative metabolite transport protein [Salmonella enterica subsp. enterica]
MTLNSPPFIAELCCGGSGGPFLDGYVLVIIGVALEQLTPLLHLDAEWIGALGAATLAGLFIGTSLFGYICDKVGRRKMFLLDIIAIGVISVATMFVSTPLELLVMRVLIGHCYRRGLPYRYFHDYGVFQHPPARVLHRFYRRDVVRRRDLRQPGGLLAV